LNDQFSIPVRVLEEEKGSWERRGGGRGERKEGTQGDTLQ